MINPSLSMKNYGTGYLDDNKSPTENRLLRLAFHDCLKSTDGSGGCDGCLDWQEMGLESVRDNFVANLERLRADLITRRYPAASISDAFPRSFF